MRKILITIAALLLMAVIAAPPAMAVGTPAGTVISNQAFVDYKDANGNALPRVLSNIVTITVSQVFALTISPLTSNMSGANLTPVYFPGRVYNLGNGNDTFTISVASAGDWNPTSVTMYADVNNNGVYDLGTDTAIPPTVPGGNTYLTPAIAADGYAPVIMAVLVPDNAVAPDGTSNTITVTVRSNSDNTKVMTATCTTTVLAAVIAATKTHTAPSGYKPGDVVTWTVTMTNTGSADATAISAIDNLPAGVTFVPGSIEVKAPGLDWQSRNDACGDDTAACYDAANRRILIPGSGLPSASPYFLPAGTSYGVRMKVTINAGVAMGTTVNNVASITYTSGASTITVNTNTNSFVVQNLAAIDLATATINKTGNPGDQIVYAFTATNNGNADDKIDFTVNSSNGWTWAIWVDSDGNGLLNAGDSLLTDTNGNGKADTNTLARNGGTIKLLAVATIPVGRADGTTDTLTIAGASVNDATKTASVAWTTTVQAPHLTIAKALVHVAQPNGIAPATCVPTTPATGAGCFYYPGSTLTYRVTVTNIGTGNATAVIIADTIPGNTTYVPGSIKTGPTVALLTTMTDVQDGDGGRFEGNSVIAGGTGGLTLGPGATWLLEFKVVIN